MSRRLLIASVAALPILGVVLAGGSFPGAGKARAAGSVTVLAGATPATTPFPSDVFTVPDAQQATGRRVALPAPGCPDATRSICDDLRLLNSLDGFDLQPRVTVPFSGPVDLLSVNDQTVFVEGPGGTRTGLRQLVVDPATNVVAGLTDAFLAPRTTYSLVVTAGLRALDGSQVDPCPTASACPAGTGERRTTFTTTSATTVLDGIQARLSSGEAYTAAGVAEADRGVRFRAVEGQPAVSSIFPAPALLPPGNIVRRDQIKTDGTTVDTSVLNAASSYATYGFGSIFSPQYASDTAVIPAVPTTMVPPERPRAAEIGVIMAAPAVVPGSCITPVVFGPGFTRSRYDLFLAADAFGGRGLALFATDPLGHARGERSKTLVRSGPTTTVLLGYGRGRDLDGDGYIGAAEGSQPTFSVTVNPGPAPTGDTAPPSTPRDPSPDATVGLRDSLIQTVADNMALVRALEKGVDVDGNGTIDTCRPTPAAPTPVRYYGQSFGGIYGTMLLGTDTHVTVGVPNVPGGPIVDIARESRFRDLISRQLQANRPSLLNGGPGLNGFTESMPLRLDPRVTQPLPGAIPLQEIFARSAWVGRAGSPETYAPRLGAGGSSATKKVIFQTAYTDGTVPNPTAGTLYRAGNLYDKVWVYRNDRTPTVNSDPHGFLLDPRLGAGRNQGQQQVLDFLVSAGTTVTDPDGPGPEWENNAALYRVQLDCLHYPDPQTGTPQARTPNSPDCTDRSNTLATPQQATPPGGGAGAGGGTGAGGGAGAGAAGSGPVELTLRASRTFVRVGERATYSGGLTRGGVAMGGQRVALTVRYVDGKVKPLGEAMTGANGSFALTTRPLYNGTVTATALDARAAVPSRVVVTFRGVRAAVAGRTVTVTAQTRPGFRTTPGRQARVQLLAVDARGRTRQVLATANAGQRHPARGEAQGVNDVRFRVTLPAGSYRLAVKVIGTPVNTGATTRPFGVRVG